MKKCVSTAIDRAASAAAIVPGPIFVLDMLKRCVTGGEIRFLAAEIKFRAKGSRTHNFVCSYQ